jgi:hypothetical protein
MRMPDPGRGKRKDLPGLLKDTPGLAVVIDTFEQPIQRPRRRQKLSTAARRSGTP